DVTGYLGVDGWRDRNPPGPWWERPKGPDGRRARQIAKRLVSELLQEGRLLPAQVEGWTDPAYVRPDARVPRTVEARALVTPFDSLLWGRVPRIQRLYGMTF